jgi:hypothetical protein
VIDSAGQRKELRARDAQVAAWKSAIASRERRVAQARVDLSILEDDLAFCRRRLAETLALPRTLPKR